MPGIIPGSGRLQWDGMGAGADKNIFILMTYFILR